MSGRSIFLSYAQQDRDAVLKLDAALRGRDVGVWRDQEKLRAGQKWPAAIGKAIDEQQALVLVWSPHAAASDFVEFEWATAYALKKPVLVCRLDDTALHPGLAALHAVPFERATDEIVRALEAEPAASDPGRRTSVFDILRRIQPTAPAEVAGAVQAEFENRGWVLGERTRNQLRDHLRGLLADLAPVPLLAVTGSDTQRPDVLLSDVYTALDTTLPIPIRNEEAERERDQKMLRRGLPGDPQYIDRLIAQVTRAAKRSDRRPEIAPDLDDRAAGRPFTALEAAAANRRLVILGPPGSGKSSFARFFALCLAGEILERIEGSPQRVNLGTFDGNAGGSPAAEHAESAWPHGPLLPVFVELRRFVASEQFPAEGQPATADHLLDFLEHRKPTGLARELAEHLRMALADGRAIVIFDGLDETPRADACRNRLRDVICSLARKYPAARLLVTSRPYAYEPGSPWRLDAQGFEEVTLAPFSDERIRAFIDRWFAYLSGRKQLEAGRANQLGAMLWERVRREPYLRPLVERPLMLTMIADLYAAGRVSLIGGRATLYERSVELLFDRWNEARGVAGGKTLAEQTGMDREAAVRALEELAYEVHGARGAEPGTGAAEITAAEVWDALNRRRPPEHAVNETEIIDYLHMRAGILLAENPRLYHFPHRSYQEYLAACHLCRTRFPNLLRDEVASRPELWREVVQFAATQVSKTPFMLWALLGSLVPAEPPSEVERDDPRCARAFLAGLALRETGAYTEVEEQDRVHVERIRLWLERTLIVGALSSRDRAEAGSVLGLLGDRRPGVGLRSDGVPDIEWVTVQEGPFLMGSTQPPVWANDEKPQHHLTLPTYSIARFPVTNEQYRAFVQDGGYSERRRNCWSAAGWKWKGEAAGPDDDLPAEFLLPNHPWVNVCWHEAQAYCRWLAEKRGEAVRLPTEAEWEKAARGPDGRVYPWGDEFEASRCNTWESEIGRTSAVGSFPDGKSRYDMFDAAGNVWEWTSSLYRSYPYRGEDGRENPDDPAEGEPRRVLRGGSWSFDQDNARAAYRDLILPDDRFSYAGFRVVRSSPISQ